MEKVVLHPLVLRNVTDHYNRVARDTGKRVVGVLTGTSFKGTIDVTSSYAVPFEEDEGDPRICNYFESMFSMFRILNAKDHVVGWYSTGPNLKVNDLCVHALFNNNVPTPVLVIIDVHSKELGLPTKAYYATEEVQENTTTKKGQKVFVHVPSEIAADEVEEIGVEHMPRDVKDTIISTLATEVIGKLAALKGLDAQLEPIRSYFDLVIEGKLPINHKIIYHLQEVLNLLPKLNVTKADKTFAVKVMHSPPPPVTVKSRTANDNFVKLSEALFVAEQKAVVAVVAVRSKVQKEMMRIEKNKEFMELYILAQKEERSETKKTSEEKKFRLLREKFREELRRDAEKEIRLEAKYAHIGKNNKISRDMSEKVALEMANTGARGGEVMCDQRLFNQEKGVDSCFVTGGAYNIYSKGLSAAQSALTTLYRPNKDGNDEMYGGADEQLDKIDTAFTGASESSGPRDGPDGLDNVQPEDLPRPRPNLDEGQE